MTYTLLEYGWMLRDAASLDAYRRALAAVITPRSIVADLGCGLGTFGLMALQLGAARVYAIEPAPIANVAAEIARVNGFEERFHVLRSRVRDAQLPARADVIVGDLGGALPLFEDHLPSVMHAREHFLAPGGTLIPAADRLLCAPISSEDVHARITANWRAAAGLDYGPAERMALNAPRAMPIETRHLAAEPQCWGVLEYATLTTADVHAELTWKPAPAAVIHGFALWFERTLLGETGFTSGPANHKSIYSTMVLPVLAPLQPDGVLTLTLDMRLIGGHYVTTWRAATRKDPGSLQSTFYSDLMDMPRGPAGC